ncbi:HdeD family acid-resistance protein [Pilimelia columellifera]|uniref:HdeD family acid-resistance protein n=1 Tax=Pilimelia columellifera subsp. columellifera TaxID=706583 RepID=A0ABP6AJ76_9ACTN
MRSSVTMVTLPDAWPLTDPYAATRAQAQTLRQHQRLSAATATAALTVATSVAAWPERTVATLGMLLGVWLVTVGVLHLVEATLPIEGSAAARAIAAVSGLLHLVVGVVCLRGLVGAVELLAVVIGIAWLAGGVSAIVSAAAGHRGGWALRGAMVTGAVGVAAGLALAFWPQATLAAITWVSAASLLGIAAVQAAMVARAGRPPTC